ncbi:MAG: TPM domain-containing protein [Odoribacter sp.]
MKHLITLITLFLTFTVLAQDFPEPMQPKRIVNDFTGLFDTQQRETLEQKLRHFNDTSSTQIAVVTIPSLQGYDPNDYAQQLAEKWGIGQKGKDNGILLLIKPKSKDERGQVAIAVGYGLEGVLPDAIASRIIRNEIIPLFQIGNYFAGVNNATNVLMKITGGEYTADQYARKGSNKRGSWIVLPFLIIFLLPVFVRKRRGYTTGSHAGGSVPPFFIGGLGGGGSNFGSFSSGSGSFGGFGGGSFGGGGSSGSW